MKNSASTPFSSSLWRSATSQSGSSPKNLDYQKRKYDLHNHIHSVSKQCHLQQDLLVKMKDLSYKQNMRLFDVDCGHLIACFLLMLAWGLYMSLILNQRIRMRMSCDDSSDFSKYFQSDDKSSLYNYSTSHTNETLLLQTTDIHQRNIVPNQNGHNVNQNHKETSLLEELYEQLEVTLEQSQMKSGNAAGGELQEMCMQLVAALRKLQSKVERMEELDKGRQKESRSDSQREVESVFTYSSKGSKVCRCEEHNPLNNLLQFVEQRSKLDIYKQEKEALQRHVIRLEVTNEDLRKQLRKMQGENLKVKELLKQYQHFNRQRQPREDYYDEPVHENYRSTTHTRCNTLDEITDCYQRRPLQKQNIKMLFERKLKDEEMRGYCKQPPMTPNPLLRTTKSPLQQNTQSKFGSQSPRMTQLNQRMERLLDMDNQKTNSKSKERRVLPLRSVFSRSPKYSNEMLETDSYEISLGKQPILEYVDTMTTLPESPAPSFFDLKRIQSSKSLLCPSERLSPLRSLQKPYKR